MAGSVRTLLGNAEKLGGNYNTAELHLSPVVAPATLSCLQQLLGVQLNGNGKLFTCTPGKVGSTNCGHLSAIHYSVCPGCRCYRQKAMTLAGTGADVPAVVPATATKLHPQGRPVRDTGVPVVNHPARRVRRQGPQRAAGEDRQDRQGRGAGHTRCCLQVQDRPDRCLHAEEECSRQEGSSRGSHAEEECSLQDRTS